MTALNPDRTIYFVLCRYRSGMDWAARDIARTCKTCTIEDIRSGELPNVQQVIELNVAEFSSRDVTEDILREAGRDDTPPLGRQAFQDWKYDRERDYRK